VAAKVLPEYHDVVAALRQLVRETVPQAEECVSYAMPVYKVNGILAYFLPNQQGITFSFTHGANFEDRYGLLRGAAKHARYVKLKSPASINHEALRDYIAQALAFDAK